MSRIFAVFSKRGWAVLVTLVLCVSVDAADENRVIFPGSTTSAESTPLTNTGGTFHSMSLFLGLALAGAGGWMVWRNRQGKPVGRELRALSIDETRSLGSRQYLVVASYEGKKFLLGVCPGRIDLLSPLNAAASTTRENSRE